MCWFFFFFQIARGSPLYTLRFSNICLQGDVSVPNRWPSFYTRTILPTLKGPSTYITCLWTLWNSSLYMNSVYSKDLSGCGECQLWRWLIFNYRRLFCTQLLYSWLLFFSQHLIGAETAWPILFGENVYFICASSEGGLELNMQRCDGSSQMCNAVQITPNLFNITSSKFINWIT